MGLRAIVCLGVLCMGLAAAPRAWCYDPWPVPDAQPAASALVPELRGLREAQARAALKAAGLRVRLSRVARACQDRGQEGRVVAQAPSPGARLARHAHVDLTVCSGKAKGRLVEVPNLVGLEPAQAQGLLQSSGLRARLSRRSPCPGPRFLGLVVSQSPGAGEKVPAGLMVVLSICPAP